MSDKQFSIGIKISIVAAILLIIAMIVLGVTTLRTKENSVSVLEDVPDAKNITIQDEVIVVEEEN